MCDKPVHLDANNKTHFIQKLRQKKELIFSIKKPLKLIQQNGV